MVPEDFRLFSRRSFDLLDVRDFLFLTSLNSILLIAVDTILLKYHDDSCLMDYKIFFVFSMILIHLGILAEYVLAGFPCAYDYRIERKTPQGKKVANTQEEASPSESDRALVLVQPNQALFGAVSQVTTVEREVRQVQVGNSTQMVETTRIQTATQASIIQLSST